MNRRRLLGAAGVTTATLGVENAKNGPVIRITSAGSSFDNWNLDAEECWGAIVVPANDSGAAAVELLCSTNDTNGVAAMRVDINGLVPTAGAVALVNDSQNRTPMLAVSGGTAWRRLPLGNRIDS